MNPYQSPADVEADRPAITLWLVLQVLWGTTQIILYSLGDAVLYFGFWPLILICWSGSVIERRAYDFLYRHGYSKHFNIWTGLFTLWICLDWLAIGIGLCCLWWWLVAWLGWQLTIYLDQLAWWWPKRSW